MNNLLSPYYKLTRIQNTKDTLAEIKRTNVKSITSLEKQLKESQVILSRMKDNERSQIIDNIFTIILALDKDNNSTLDDHEIDSITKKTERIGGLEIDDELFKQKIIENGRDLDAVLTLLNGLLDDDPNTAPEERKIFKFVSTSKM